MSVVPMLPRCHSYAGGGIRRGNDVCGEVGCRIWPCVKLSAYREFFFLHRPESYMNSGLQERKLEYDSKVGRRSARISSLML
ncbi:hypothetical protein VTO42DRAFT_7619 [Malbranchea cinnamomea]